MANFLNQHPDDDKYKYTPYWDHRGGFVVHVTDDVDITAIGGIPANLAIYIPERKIIIVWEGRIKETFAGIQMYAGDADEYPFFLQKRQMRTIRGLTGLLLWKN